MRIRLFFFTFILGLSLALVGGCATHVEIEGSGGGHIYWPPRSGDDLKIVNNVVASCMEVDYGGVQMPGDTVADGRYCTGQVAHFFFSTQVYGYRRNVELLCRFYDEGGSYIGSEVVRFSLRARVGERESDVVIIDSVRSPRTR